MTADEKKQLILDQFEATTKGDYARCIDDFLADDATWWTAGKFEGYRPGARSKAEIREIFCSMPVLFPKGLHMTADHFIIEGDWVAVEAHSYAPVTQAGKPYRQQYHFVFEVKDGKIRTVREYLDTQHVAQALMGR